ncbi:hypothetical protein KEM48_005712 [Puccinia striiformis f. sp. tritici PST-130]|nr:hypothetical protein KEM48_005712 [Puccinia striiformis f. sp. tritici PST-130]
MAFTRNMISLLMVSIWVGMVMSATTNNLDASKKAPAGGANKTTVGTIAGDAPVATCTNIDGMVDIRVAKDSISTPIKAWLNGMCKAPVCDPAALAAAAEKFKTGCAAEMASKSMDAAAFYSLLTTYKTIRDEGCKNTQQLNFCDPTLAGHIQSWTKNERPFFSVPKAAYCLECGKSQPPPPGSKPTTKHPLCGDNPSKATGIASKPVVIALHLPMDRANPRRETSLLDPVNLRRETSLVALPNVVTTSSFPPHHFSSKGHKMHVSKSMLVILAAVVVLAVLPGSKASFPCNSAAQWSNGICGLFNIEKKTWTLQEATQSKNSIRFDDCAPKFSKKCCGDELAAKLENNVLAVNIDDAVVREFCDPNPPHD